MPDLSHLSRTNAEAYAVLKDQLERLADLPEMSKTNLQLCVAVNQMGQAGEEIDSKLLDALRLTMPRKLDATLIPMSRCVIPRAFIRLRQMATTLCCFRLFSIPRVARMMANGWRTPAAICRANTTIAIASAGMTCGRSQNSSPSSKPGQIHSGGRPLLPSVLLALPEFVATTTERPAEGLFGAVRTRGHSGAP